MLEETLAKSSIQCVVEGGETSLQYFKKIEKYSTLGKDLMRFMILLL